MVVVVISTVIAATTYQIARDEKRNNIFHIKIVRLFPIIRGINAPLFYVSFSSIFDCCITCSAQDKTIWAN